MLSQSDILSFETFGGGRRGLRGETDNLLVVFTPLLILSPFGTITSTAFLAEIDSVSRGEGISCGSVMTDMLCESSSFSTKCCCGLDCSSGKVLTDSFVSP